MQETSGKVYLSSTGDSQLQDLELVRENATDKFPVIRNSKHDVLYAAIRKHIGGKFGSSDVDQEWLDITTIRPLLHCSKAEADRCDQEIPNWAVWNPVVRVVKIKCCIVEDLGSKPFFVLEEPV